MTSSNASRPSGRNKTKIGPANLAGSGEERLARAFQALGKEPTQSSMHEMRQRLEDAERRIQPAPGLLGRSRGDWKVNLLNQLKSVKAIIAMSLLVLVAACSVPVEVEEDHGLELIAQTENPDALLDELRSGRWELGNLKLWQDDSGMTTVMATLLNAAPEDLKILEQIKGVSDLTARANVETVERSLFGAVMSNFFEIHVNSTGMSDAELNAAINEQLAQQGFGGNVQLTRTEDGQRLDVVVDDALIDGMGEEGGQIFISLDEDESTDGTQSQQHVRLKVGEPDGGALSGDMTDEEIRAQIIEQLISDGMNPDDATISINRVTTEDGEQIKVEVGVESEE